MPARVALVKAEYFSGNIDGSLVEARKLAEDNPADGDAQLLYGRILLRKEDYAGALAPLERAAELLPTSHEVPALLGKAYQLNRQYKDAASSFKRALEVAPDNLDHRLEYATMLAQSKRFDAAIAEIKTVTSTPGYKDPLAFLRLGSLYLTMEPKKPLEASIAFREARKLDTRNAQAAFGLGRAQFLGKQYVDAAGSFEQAAVLDRKLAPEAYLMTGWAHLELAHQAKNQSLVARSQASLSRAVATGLSPRDPRLIKLKAAIARFGTAPVEPPKEDKREPEGPDLAKVVKSLSHPDAGLRGRAARECVAFGADCVQYLRPMLNTDADLSVRVNVARALGAIGSDAAAACPQLGREIADSGERMVLPPANHRLSPEEEARRFGREQGVQSACREARTKIGCK